MKSIEANNVVKTLRWISEIEKDKYPEIDVVLNKNNLYQCVIYLPLIDKTVIGLGDSKLESINNATKKASDLIDEYIRRTSYQNFKYKSDDYDYFLKEDSNQNLCIHLVEKGVKC